MLRTEDPGFILLCGCPRSGTTLLSQHFGSALGIAMPIETHFIPHFRRYLALWGDIDAEPRQRRLVEAMVAYTHIWIYRGIRAQSPERHASISLLPMLERFEPVQGGYPAILDKVYRSYAERAGLRYHGDKSATFDSDALALYDASVPELKVIHLIRDGRDVWCSWKPQWFGPRTLAEAAWIWRRHIESRRAWGGRHPDRYVEIRFEDFLADPDAVLCRVADFLRVERPAVQPGRDILGEVLSNEPTHTKLADPVDRTNTGNWATQMNPQEVRLFEYIAGDTLDRCGYTRSTSLPLSVMDRIAFRSALVGGLLRRYASPNYFMRKLRTGMPLAFRVAQLLHIRPGTIATALSRRAAFLPRETSSGRRPGA